MRELAPYAGVVAALGVALLLLARPVPARLAGIVLFGVGVAGVGLYREPSFRDRLSDRPLVWGAAMVVGLAIVAAAGIVASRWMWLPPALLAVAGLRIPYSTDPTPTQGLVPVYAAVAIGLAALAWRLLRGRARPVRLGYVGPALAVIVALGAASQFWVVDLQTGTYTLLAFYLPFAVLAALVAELDPERLPVAGAVVLQVGLAVLFALVGIYQWATETIWWNDLLETANRYTSSFRVNSLFISPAPFGRFEALALITIVALLALGPPRRAIVALAAAGPLLLVGLALSYSRTAMVAMVAGLVVLSLIVWRRPAAIALGIGAVAAILLALALPQTRDAFSGGGEKLSSNRLSLSERGFEEFKERPLHGVGLGGFVAGSRLLEEKTRRGHSPHNVVLTTAAELGVLGLAALVALFAAAMHAAFRPRDPGWRRVLRLVVALELGVIGLHALSETYAVFEDPMSWVLLGVLASLSLAPTASTATTSPASP
jgi:O-antigen ligase